MELKKGEANGLALFFVGCLRFLKLPGENVSQRRIAEEAGSNLCPRTTVSRIVPGKGCSSKGDQPARLRTADLSIVHDWFGSTIVSEATAPGVS